MANHVIKVERREDEGKGASRRLRRAKRIPAIVYGGELKPVSIQLNHEEIWLASQNDWFYSSILDLSLNGDIQKVLLRDMQRHPYKQIIMHLDFQRVSDNEELRTSVPLRFVNEETSPAGKLAGVLIMHELNEVEVVCLPKDLPEFIEVDLANLQLGDVIHLSDLKAPKGIEFPALHLAQTDKEHDAAVVIAKHARVEEAPAAEEGESAGEAKGEDK
ncbi:MAG: 50S ribosomal protein L25/general stress protein Ctc [Xanthomonadaceae bacterium]|jgi:large subunit ribosomal protein L25|nr:50S ribosomal protein L25/general stress protein Ctc [Xanthomonadaceae bacterium]